MQDQGLTWEAVQPRGRRIIVLAGLTIVLSAIAIGDSRAPWPQDSVEAKVSIEQRGMQVTFAWHDGGRSRAVREDLVAADSLYVSAVYRGVYGPRERGVCGDGYAERSALQQYRVWDRCGNIFSWICAVRSAKQSDPASDRDTDMDRAHHDLVGCGLSLHGVGGVAKIVLSFEVSARSGRGWVCSGHASLFDFLVPFA